jgi:hypothetical protein
MTKKIVYTDYDLGEVERVKDFLPSPDQLALRQEKVKVTMEMTKRTVDYFKTQAKKYKTSYQLMVRNLLDAYVAKQ